MNARIIIVSLPTIFKYLIIYQLERLSGLKRSVVRPTHFFLLITYTLQRLSEFFRFRPVARVNNILYEDLCTYSYTYSQGLGRTKKKCLNLFVFLCKFSVDDILTFIFVIYFSLCTLCGLTSTHTHTANENTLLFVVVVLCLRICSLMK